jgi:hypothetical protein
LIEQTLLLGFAAWRLASMLVHEDGPGEAFLRLRNFAGVPDEGEVAGFFPSLLSCVWCASVWCVLGLWAVWELWRPEPVIIVAAMSAAPLFERYLGR